MPDDVIYTDPIRGQVQFATDEIAGVNYQRVKPSLGADGSATDWPGDGTFGGMVDITRIAPERCTALGDGQLTGLSASTALSTISGGIPANTLYVVIQAEGQAVRYRIDNVAPTASVGRILAVGDSDILALADYTRVKFIETTSSAKINVNFLG